MALDGDPQSRLADRQIDRRLQRAAIAIRDDILTDADFSADRVKVDGAAADPQDGMLSRDAGVPQDDVGAWRGADTDIARFKLEAHAAMKAGRALEHERRRRRRDGGGKQVGEGRHHPGSGHFGPHILRLDVHKVDRRHRKNRERHHKGPSSSEKADSIWRRRPGPVNGHPGSAPCRRLPWGAAASPAPVLSRRGDRGSDGVALLTHPGGATSRPQLVRPSDPHVPGGRVRVIEPCR